MWHHHVRPLRRIAAEVTAEDYGRADRIFVAYEGMLQGVAYIVRHVIRTIGIAYI